MKATTIHKNRQMFKMKNPKAEQIQADNEVRMRWNHEADRA